MVQTILAAMERFVLNYPSENDLVHVAMTAPLSGSPLLQLVSALVTQRNNIVAVRVRSHAMRVFQQAI
jgi:hypothetical protein